MPNGPSNLDFKPGAIVRVCVDNFVTYEHAEFFPGPHLNMVIGPNGTGKSSLVCAICLGLGYHSNVLGRASAFGEFVKHGKDHAVVEVELQRGADQPNNHVVRLRINRDDNSRKFWINGRESTHKNVQKVIQSMRIQIDNLCQFLPQDKVAEFAGLNSVDLLTKTLQAAASEEMIMWQDQLRELFAEQKEAQKRVKSDAEQLTLLENRQGSLQADVEKLKERKQILEAIENLEGARVLVVYNTARKNYQTAKKRTKEIKEGLKALQDSFAPSLEAVNKKQDYQARVEAVVQGRKRALREAEDATDKIVGEVEALGDKTKGLDTKFEAQNHRFSEARQEIAKIRKKITDLEAAHKQAPAEFDAAEWNRRIVSFLLPPCHVWTVRLT
jgi:chromosome segregation ATPase